MHTHSSKSANFNFNSDFSGEIIITDIKGKQIAIQGKDLLEFVAEEYIKQKAVSKIEQMDGVELLNNMLNK